MNESTGRVKSNDGSREGLLARLFPNAGEAKDYKSEFTLEPAGTRDSRGYAREAGAMRSNIGYHTVESLNVKPTRTFNSMPFKVNC